MTLLEVIKTGAIRPPFNFQFSNFCLFCKKCLNLADNCCNFNKISPIKLFRLRKTTKQLSAFQPRLQASTISVLTGCTTTTIRTMQDIHNPKNTVTPLLTLDGENVNFNYYKHLGIVLDTDLSDDKGIGRQLRYQCCAVNKLRAFFSRYPNAV